MVSNGKKVITILTILLQVREAHVLQDLQRRLKKDKAEYEAAIQALKVMLHKAYHSICSFTETMIIELNLRLLIQLSPL